MWFVQYPFNNHLTFVFLKRSSVKRTVKEFFLPHDVCAKIYVCLYVCIVCACLCVCMCACVCVCVCVCVCKREKERVCVYMCVTYFIVTT